jgi:hypothetical protein
MARAMAKPCVAIRRAARDGPLAGRQFVAKTRHGLCKLTREAIASAAPVGPLRITSQVLEALQLLPVRGDAPPALRRQRDVGVGLLAHKALLDADEARVLQLAQVAGEVALGQPGGAQQEDEVGVG